MLKLTRALQRAPLCVRSEVLLAIAKAYPGGVCAKLSFLVRFVSEDLANFEKSEKHVQEHLFPLIEPLVNLVVFYGDGILPLPSCLLQCSETRDKTFAVVTNAEVTATELYFRGNVGYKAVLQRVLDAYMIILGPDDDWCLGCAFILGERHSLVVSHSNGYAQDLGDYQPSLDEIDELMSRLTIVNTRMYPANHPLSSRKYDYAQIMHKILSRQCRDLEAMVWWVTINPTLTSLPEYANAIAIRSVPGWSAELWVARAEKLLDEGQFSEAKFLFARVNVFCALKLNGFGEDIGRRVLDGLLKCEQRREMSLRIGNTSSHASANIRSPASTSTFALRSPGSQDEDADSESFYTADEASLYEMESHPPRPFTIAN